MGLLQCLGGAVCDNIQRLEAADYCHRELRLRCCSSPIYISPYLLTFNLLGLDPFNTVLSFHFHKVYLFSFFLYPRINKDEIKINKKVYSHLSKLSFLFQMWSWLLNVVVEHQCEDQVYFLVVPEYVAFWIWAVYSSQKFLKK